MGAWPHTRYGDHIIKTISSVSERHGRASATANHIADTSHEIKFSIGEIVKSLQFHDITRQQIEHVMEAIDELNEKISALKEPEDVARKAGNSILLKYSAYRPISCRRKARACRRSEQDFKKP